MSYFPGVDNILSAALSREVTPAMEWILDPEVFSALQSPTFSPQVDLFVSQANSKVPQFLACLEQMGAGGPDAFTVEWVRWNRIYLFPPPNTSTLLNNVTK